MHCYIGCEIAQQVSPQTAEYAGWFKELKDLQDGDCKTQFDPKRDYDATVIGSKITGNCRSECESKYGKP